RRLHRRLNWKLRKTGRQKAPLKPAKEAPRLWPRPKKSRPKKTGKSPLKGQKRQNRPLNHPAAAWNGLENAIKRPLSKLIGQKPTHWPKPSIWRSKRRIPNSTALSNFILILVLTPSRPTRMSAAL